MESTQLSSLNLLRLYGRPSHEDATFALCELTVPRPEQIVQCGKSGRENMGTEHVLLIHSFQAHDISGSVGGA